jgi:hypothetical protein
MPKIADVHIKNPADHLKKLAHIMNKWLADDR